MARITIIETYPYEADWGGEAVYLDRLRQFLLRGGHHVENLVTDVTRGRATPLFGLRTSGLAPRWRVRRAIQWRAGRFVSTSPRLILRAAGRLLGFRGNRDDPIDVAERSWALKHIAATRPDIVIPVFGSCMLSGVLAERGYMVAAIRGFFVERVTRLSAPEAAPAADIPRQTLDELCPATLACFNNLPDLALYRERTGADNGALLGMGFTRRIMAASAEPVLLFVGAFTRPNVQALRWFLDGCWPAILAARPAATIRVVGTVGRGFEDANIDQVAFAGFAPDLTDEYRRAQLVIAPLLVGTNGVKTKVAEALSHGRPVVTTSVGVDRPGQFGDAVAVADAPDAFARHVIEVLTDETIRERRTAAAEGQYERHFSEAAAYAPLAALIDRIAREPAGATP